MIYHAKITYIGGDHFWWNYSEQEILDEIIVPFINGQVIPANLDGHVSLLNMRTVTFLRVYKTQKKLTSTKPLSPPDELREPGFELTECTEEILNLRRQERSTPLIKSLIQKMLSPIIDQVFVIMKFNDKFLDSAYLGVIKPIIQEFGLKPLRVDEIPDSGKITDQVLEAIAISKFILADLSGERPNCYYETGFAHALGKEIVLTVRANDKIHFDLAQNRFIVWETESDLRNALRQRIESICSKAN